MQTELTDGEMLLGVGLLKNLNGPYIQNLLFLKRNLAAVLDGLRALSTEPDVDDNRRRLIYEAEVEILKANTKLEDAFSGLN